MVVKTFRGMLADGGQDRLKLQTIKGKVGYRIVKFQLFAAAPGTTDYENVVKIFKLKQTSLVSTVNFTDGDILAAAYLEGYSGSTYTDQHTVVFDQEVFNQDIYITHVDALTGESINYYLELEVIPLDDAGAEYTTLKDMRAE